MKKTNAFWVLFSFLATTLLLFYSFAPRMAFFQHGDGVILAVSRKLKEDYNLSADQKGNDGHVNLEDYHTIDPAPSSKAATKPGPIQHGTPLMPYIPKPSPPPSHPKRGGSP